MLRVTYQITTVIIKCLSPLMATACAVAIETVTAKEVSPKIVETLLTLLLAR